MFILPPRTKPQRVLTVNAADRAVRAHPQCRLTPPNCRHSLTSFHQNFGRVRTRRVYRRDQVDGYAKDRLGGPHIAEFCRVCSGQPRSQGEIESAVLLRR